MPTPALSDDELFERFAAWADGRDDLEPDVVDTLFTLKGDYLGEEDPTLWRTGQLTALMTDVLPRKVTVDEEWIEAAVPTVRAFLAWASEQGLLAPGSSPLRELTAELDEIAPNFAAGMHDSSRFGLAKSILSSMDFDPADPAQLQAAVDQFNAMPEGDRRRITDPALGLGGVEPDVVLPPVTLPTVAELAAAAREAPLMRQIVQLVEWIEPRKAATATGVLTLAGARQAVAALGLDPDAESGRPGPVPPKPVRKTASQDDPATLDLGPGLEPVPGLERIRSARDVPVLTLLYGLAEQAELIGVGSTFVAAGPGLDAWRTGDDEEVLDVWLDVFAGLLDRGVDGGREPRWRLPTDEAVDEGLGRLLPLLYTGESVSVGKLIAETVAAVPRMMAGLLVPDPGDHATALWEEVLGRLVAAGALRREGDSVSMSPLGRWGLREQLLQLGAEAPVLRDPAGAEAGELAGVVARMAPEEMSRVWQSWIAARSPEQAAEELVSAARDGSPLTRTVCVATLVQLSEEGAAVLGRYVDDPVVGAHAKSVLAGVDLLPLEHSVDPGERHWLAVDAVAAYLELLDEPVAARSLPPEIVGLIEDTVDFPTVWTVEHPQLLEVLDGVGLGHPQGRVRKAAQKAAHKARKRSMHDC